MERLLRASLARFVRAGNLRVTTARGTTFTLGDGTGPPAAMRFVTRRAELGLLVDPELRFGEAYMDGEIVIERGSITDVLAILLGQEGGALLWANPRRFARLIARRIQQFNPRWRARRNVAHHYDLSTHFYGFFLDSDRQYSCAYFEHPGQSLDDAQLAKKRHLAAKLLLDSNTQVLDIGCGWGGLALYLAEFCGSRVTGITLSEQQHSFARGRAADRSGTAGEVEFRLQDYRDVAEKYDRIVSVGMFEHVGVGFYPAFFRKCRALLNDDGVMLLHSIGRSEGPNVTNPWIAKYIFPGGYIPALSEVLPAVERAGFLVTDVEILRLHYADTLKAWRERFLAHREEVEQMYDARFVRMWEFYLAASEMTFREQQAMMVFQLQLAKKQGVVPITRDYIEREEERLRQRERTARAPWRLAGE
jgi:cyclopropane-fatty-acyl-phospholipid synthase